MTLVKTMLDCKWDGCDRPAKHRGYCVRCYQRAVKAGVITTTKQTSRGLSKYPEYWIWAAIKRRCYYENDSCFHLYGGRGITMCQDWRESCAAFINDMGFRPTDKHQIDRIDTNGNYEPDNCRWVLPHVNAQNTRRCKLKAEDVQFILDSPLTGQALSEMFNCHYSTISKVRRHKNWKRIGDSNEPTAGDYCVK